MPVRVLRYDATPNPNAVKCILSTPLSTHPRSFLNREMAADDPLASALFQVEGVTNILINADWMTVGKHPEASWSEVKRGVGRVLEGVSGPGE